MFRSIVRSKTGLSLTDAHRNILPIILHGSLSSLRVHDPASRRIRNTVAIVAGTMDCYCGRVETCSGDFIGRVPA